MQRAEPVIMAYAKLCKRLGESGAGQLTKMVNQICIAGLVQGLSEGLHFAEKAGLDGREVVEVIKGGAAGSWQMANRFETMLDDHFTMASRWTGCARTSASASRPRTRTGRACR
jgi:3-hydroxyisobutyrate dehydrogenase